jgi:RNA polymerase sigma-70 factor (ECF subfamily)
MPTLEEIYRTHLDLVFRVCLRYCKERSEAEDLTQDVFIRIDRTLGSFRGEAQLSTWIYRLAINCCLDHLRKKRRQQKLQVENIDELVLDNVHPGDHVLAKIDLDRILKQFRPEVRRILFLTLAEGMSYRQAGEILGIPKDTVAKTVSRFLAKFKPSASPQPPQTDSGAVHEKIAGNVQ